jgi:uncharacterized protein YjcR
VSNRPESDTAKARRLYLQGNTVPEIAELTGIPVRTIYQWRDNAKWDARFAEEACIATAQRRWLCLCEREEKSDADYREMEFLIAQMDKLVAVAVKQARLAHPESAAAAIEDQPEKKKRKSRRNDLSQVGTGWLDKFLQWMTPYQRDLWEHRHERLRDILKARQIGLTMYFAREAFADCLLTGDNQVFLSASRAQAEVFREYIREAAWEWFEVELLGKDRIELVTPHGVCTLYFLSTNSSTAQSYHGHVYIDEAFWIPKFAKLNKVASAMAAHKKWRKTYFSTPSARSHEMYPFWSGDAYNAGRKAQGRPLVKFPSTRELRERGQRCADGQWRRVITIEDAVAAGCTFFDVEQLRQEYSPAEFAQLFMCEFIDDTAGVFRLGQLEDCMVDAAASWRDVDRELTPPYGGPVWIGYDPARSSDGALITVLAPPTSVRGAFRVIERFALRGIPWQQQAETIRELCQQYRVEYIGVDTTGQGSGVFEMVQRFFPAVTSLYYTLEQKTRLVLKAQQVIEDRRIQWDAGMSDIAAAFLLIRRAVTASGARPTFVADRDISGHADPAWAIMHALIHEGLLTPDDAPRAVIEMQD